MTQTAPAPSTTGPALSAQALTKRYGPASVLSGRP